MDPYRDLAGRYLRINDCSAGETGIIWREVRVTEELEEQILVRNVTSTYHEKVEAPSEHADPDRNIK